MKETINIVPPKKFREIPRQLSQKDLVMYRKFLLSLHKYSKSITRAYGLLRDDEAYICVLPLLRMAIDNCITAYSLLLVNEKQTFLERFFEGKPINQMCCGSSKLTHKFIVGEMEKKYVGISNLYDESNKYLHPSAFLGLSKKFRKKVKTQSTRYCWFSKVSGLKKNDDKLDFLIRTLTIIFYDIFWDVFNEVVVPLNPECKVVNKPAKMPNTQITIKAYLEFTENKKNQENPD